MFWKTFRKLVCSRSVFNRFGSVIYILCAFCRSLNKRVTSSRSSWVVSLYWLLVLGIVARNCCINFGNAGVIMNNFLVHLMFGVLATSYPGSLTSAPRPTLRQRPWIRLVTWNSKGGVAKSICHSCRFLTLGTFQVALYCRNAIRTKNSGSGNKLNTFRMVQLRDIPMRVYAKSNLDSKCRGRFYCSVIDPKNCQSLYNKAGVNALASAELLYG